MARGDAKNGLMAAVMELYFEEKLIPNLGWTGYRGKMKQIHQNHDVLNVQFIF